MDERIWDYSRNTIDGYYADLNIYLADAAGEMDRRRKKFKLPAFCFRLTALLAAVCGVIFPLVIGKEKLFPFHHEGVELGYIAFAIGALALLADQVFACSTSWSRLRLAQLQLVGLKNDLEFEWAKERPKLEIEGGAIAQAEKLLEILKNTKAKAHLVNEMQMKTWFMELAEGRDAVAARIS